MPKCVPFWKGGNTCCISNCRNNTRNDKGISFHKFPREESIREEWIRRIRFFLSQVSAGPRSLWYPYKNSLVCGAHFRKDGKKRKGDLYPIYMGKFIFRNVESKPPNLLEEGQLPEAAAYETVPNRRNDVVAKLTRKPKDFKDHSYCQTRESENLSPRENEANLKLQISVLESKLAAFIEENAILKERLRCVEEKSRNNLTKMFNFENISEDDKKLEFYTGFRSKKDFLEIYEYIEPDLPSLNVYNSSYQSMRKKCRDESSPGRPMALDFKNQLFLVLCRLKVGMLEEDLAYRFQISVSTVSNIWITWVDLLYRRLPRMTIWPSRRIVDKYMPESFRALYPSTRIIIDCTELFIETPHDYNTQSDTYSSYKSHNTAKGLIGITPNGFVSFVSDLSPGRISDKEITNSSGLYKKLEPGDSVMADRGFLISEDLEKIGVSLNIPPFLQDRTQLTEAEVKKTRDIANLRIHVERVIRELKTNRILKYVFPNCMHEELNKVWKICAYLVNFKKEPLLNRESKK